MQINGLKTLIGAGTLAVGMLFGQIASAATVLTFEGLQNLEFVQNYYNGGLGSLGSGPGPNFGVTFGAPSQALISSVQGGSGNINLLPSGKTALFFLSGSDVMNVPGGFTTGFSFFYSAPFFTGTVTVYSGLNATGSVLGTIPLPLTTNGATVPACLGRNFCPYFPIGVSFAGTAQSVDFGGTANQIVFDDITIGSSIAGGGGGLTPVPALEGWALVALASLLAMGGFLVLRRRRV